MSDEFVLNGTVKRIPDWNKKHLTCYFCGSDKSVKYQIERKRKNGTIFCCNRCILSVYTK